MGDFMTTFKNRFFFILGIFLQIFLHMMKEATWISDTFFEQYLNKILPFLCFVDIFYSKIRKKKKARRNIPIPQAENNAPNVAVRQIVNEDETRRLNSNNETRNNIMESAYDNNVSHEYSNLG